MNEQERFNGLWTDYVEGDLDEAGFTELRELMADYDGRLAGAVDDFQTHRLLGLHAQDSEERHDSFVRQTMSKLPMSRDDFVGQVIGRIRRPADRRVVQWIPNRALAAAAVIVVMASIWFFSNPRTAPIATISNLSGPALWTGDAGAKPVRLSGPIHSWASDMSKGRERMYGKWQPDSGVDGGRLWAIPYVTEKKKTIFTTAVPVPRSRTQVILESDSQIRVRGRLGARSRVWVGLTLRQPNGDFAGRFQVVLPAKKFAPNQGFELLLPLTKFGLDPSLNHLRDKLPTQPEGLVIGSMWCHTLYSQAKLGVSHFSVEPAAD